MSTLFDRLLCAPLRCLGRRRESAREADLPQELAVPVRPPPEFLPHLPRFPDLNQIVFGAASGFLKRLPLEVRLKIYALVLGGHVFHLERISTRMIRQAGFSCSAPLHSMFWTLLILPPGGWWYDGANLALLFSCRQIYREAVSLLYSHNTFHFNDPMAFIDLVTYCLSPPFVLALRSVHITYYYKEVKATTDFDRERFTVEAWRRMWQLIKEMRLMDLSLELIFDDSYVNGDEEWRKPMLAVGKLKTFTLKVVGWRGERPSDDDRNLVNQSLEIAEPVQRRIRAIVSQDRVERERESESEDESERDWHQLQQRSARTDDIRQQDPTRWNIYNS